MIAYTVRCTFTGEPSVADAWVAWLNGEHIQDVINAGASSGEVVRMDGDELTYEVRYKFPSREVFDRYLADHAPALRAEGLQRFPLDRGLNYSRSIGEVVARIG